MLISELPLAIAERFPVSLISEGMAHSNEKITPTYLDSFGKEALDEMNESLLK